MADQILWLETLFKGIIGLILLTFPITAARAAGLPHGNSPFWPRLFGTALLGIAAAFAVEGYSHLNPDISYRGLGLGGAVAINFITVMSLFGTILLRGVKTTRGIVLLWLLNAALIALMLFEIAYA